MPFSHKKIPLRGPYRGLTSQWACVCFTEFGSNVTTSHCYSIKPIAKILKVWKQRYRTVLNPLTNVASTWKNCQPRTPKMPGSLSTGRGRGPEYLPPFRDRTSRFRELYAPCCRRNGPEVTDDPWLGSRPPYPTGLGRLCALSGQPSERRLDSARSTKSRWRACALLPFRPPLRPLRRNRHPGAATSAGACAVASRARAQPPILPGWSFCSSRSSSRSPPPSQPRPGTSVWSREGSGRYLVLTTRPWSALAARGTGHGDGSSERVVWAAGESGDGHDGPQLHPALPAGSPQGRRGLAPRACPKTLPQPQRSSRSPKPCWFPAHAALGPPTATPGGLSLSPPRPPRLFSLRAFSANRASPSLGTLRFLAASHLITTSHCPLLSFPHFCSVLPAPQPDASILLPQAPHPLGFPWRTCPSRPQHQLHSWQSPLH